MPQSKYPLASIPFPLPKLTFSSSLFPLLRPSPLRFPSGLDIWYLLHVQSQVSGQNSPLDHLQSGLVLVQGETAQDLVSLKEKNRQRDIYPSAGQLPDLVYVKGQQCVCVCTV